MIGTLKAGFSLTGRAFEFLSREVRGMHAAAYVLGFSSLLSSLLALLRDRMLAHTFGAGIELDLYYAAFRIPDLLFVCVGALVSAYVLIPVIASRDQSLQQRYIDAILLSFSFIAVLISAALVVAAPSLLRAFFPAFAGEETFPTLVALTRILLLQPILLGCSNILAAVTQSRHRYALYATAPIVYNMGILVGIVVLYPLFGLAGLAWGVVIGAAFHFLIQVPSVWKDGFLRTASIRAELSDILTTVRISVPRALALSMNQIAFLGLLIIAGNLAVGSISIFMLAFNLHAVPLAIIGASYSVAAFPTLAILSRGSPGEFVAYVATAARHVIFWSLPALGLMIVLRAHVVRVVLGSGEFDWTDTRLAAAALALFAVSLAAQGITLLLVRAYYASGKTMTPLFVSAGTAASAILLAYLGQSAFRDPGVTTFLESFLRVEYVQGADILALPFAYSLASLIGVFVLSYLFNREYGGFVAAIGRTIGESLTAAFVGAIFAYGTLVVLGTVTFSSTLASVFVRGGIAGMIGIIAAAAVYALLGNREFAETVQGLTRKIWRDVEPVSSAESADPTLT